MLVWIRMSGHIGTAVISEVNITNRQTIRTILASSRVGTYLTSKFSSYLSVWIR